MATFRYRARALTGDIVRGTLQAANEARAGALLAANNLRALDLESITETTVWNRTVIGGRVNTRDLFLVTRQLASMIKAGVPILSALRALQKTHQKQTLQKLLNDIIQDIEAGQSLSTALAKYPTVFSPFYVGMARTGEASGTLAKTLAVTADYLEQNYVFTRKLRLALMYPAFVLTAVIVVILLMFSFVVPQLTLLFTEANVALPLPTRILVAIAYAINNYWYIGVLLLVVFGLLGRSYFKSPEGRYVLSSAVLRVPIFRSLWQKIYLARLTSLLATLFDSDVPIIQSLTLARDSIGNRVYQRILEATIAAVTDGGAISSVWEHEELMPTLLTTMVAVGEQSGEVSKAFKESHEFFHRDVTEMLDTISVLLEPVLVVILGIGVAVVVAAVLLPIYNLVQVI